MTELNPGFAPGASPLSSPKARAAAVSEVALSSESASRSEPTPQWQRIDLDGDPASFPEHVQVYLCLLAEAVNRPPGSYKHIEDRGPEDVDSDDALVTPSRVEAGLDILRKERQHPTEFGRLFMDALPHPRSARQEFPFLPRNLDLDQLERFTPPAQHEPGAVIDRFGNLPVFTDCIVPFPREFAGVRPKSLLHLIVSLLYSDVHPAVLTTSVPYIANYGEPDEMPISDMDALYTDEWIKEEMVRQVREQIVGWRRSFQMGFLPDAVKYTLPWVVVGAVIEPANLLDPL